MNGHFAKHSSRSSRWLIASVAVLLCTVVCGWGGSGALAQSPTPAQPNATCPAGGQCFADVPSSNPFYTFINRIYQQDLVSGYPCGGTGELCDPFNRPYYRPVNNVTRQQMAKFIDNARRLPQIHIDVVSGTIPIYANNTAGTAIAAYSTSGQALVAQSSSQIAIYAQTGNSTAISGFSTGGTNGVGVSGDAYIGVSGIGQKGVQGSGIVTGVFGISTYGTGVYGHSTLNHGVRGNSESGDGVIGESTYGYGVYGTSVNTYGVSGYSVNSYGVYGYSGNASSQAGHFDGDVYVSGHITATGGCCAGPELTTRIDDPLDPANKYLYHSSVESPDMMDIYNGNVTTDANGEAVVTLPDYFEALNEDFRYQLTVVGQFAQAFVSSKIKDNHFSIKTDKPNVEVSWQVTGIRRDPYANAHRTPVEQGKPTNEQGKYLHPAEYGQPESAGVNYDENRPAQHPAGK